MATKTLSPEFARNVHQNHEVASRNYGIALNHAELSQATQRALEYMANDPRLSGDDAIDRAVNSALADKLGKKVIPTIDMKRV